MKQFLLSILGSALTLTSLHAFAQTPPLQRISHFEIDTTEVTVAQFRSFAQAIGMKTAAETSGGNTFEAGWEQRKGWNWQTPFGKPAAGNEPAVHVNYHEAAAYCRRAGSRLPTDAEWREAAYTERRTQPTDGFITGRTYRYPTGDNPQGANCLGDCGSVKTVAHAVTSRGKGHSEVATTKRGVNGLYDMGGNAWEWVDSGSANEKRTRGGSWWYGAASMVDAHHQSKPAAMSAVYIGFRCVRDLR